MKAIIEKEQIEAYAAEFYHKSPKLYIPEDGVYAAGCSGMKMFEEPIFAYGSAYDPLFEEFKAPHIIGPHYLTPKQWLPEAKSVISFFLPFSEDVRNANKRDNSWPANAWYHGRIDGEQFLLSMSIKIADMLTGNGWKAVIPDCDEMPEHADSRFRLNMGAAPLESCEIAVPGYNSTWSERHAAYVCGLGTFSLTRALITSKGCAGRFGSIITDIPLQPSERNYSHYMEYCSSCGACIKRCPAGAISIEHGKNQLLCSSFLKSTKTVPPYVGCGKCQVAVPCESRIPDRKKSV